MAKDNKQLGLFKLDGIAPARRGIPQIEVTFDIDVNGIVNVSAVDKGTNKKQSITISNDSGLSEEEIQQMVRDAEEHAEEDAKAKETAELKNRAEQFIHQVNTSLESDAETITPEQREEVEKLRDELQTALDNNDMDTLKEKLDALEAAAQTMAESMYAQQNAEGQEGPQAETNDDVVDAEFEEKN